MFKSLFDNDELKKFAQILRLCFVIKICRILMQIIFFSELKVLQYFLPNMLRSTYENLQFVKIAYCYQNISIAY
jgi:hypothetical protein